MLQKVFGKSSKVVPSWLIAWFTKDSRWVSSVKWSLESKPIVYNWSMNYYEWSLRYHCWLTFSYHFSPPLCMISLAFVFPDEELWYLLRKSKCIIMTESFWSALQVMHFQSLHSSLWHHIMLLQVHPIMEYHCLRGTLKKHITQVLTAKNSVDYSRCTKWESAFNFVTNPVYIWIKMPRCLIYLCVHIFWPSLIENPY